jgi:hypothetical protein
MEREFFSPMYFGQVLFEPGMRTLFRSTRHVPRHYYLSSYTYQGQKRRTAIAAAAAADGGSFFVTSSTRRIAAVDLCHPPPRRCPWIAQVVAFLSSLSSSSEPLKTTI